METTLRKYPKLKNYLTAISKCIPTCLEVQSIILFGGIALDDFSQKYSDIDIVVVLRNGLSDKDHSAIEKAITDLREFNQTYSHLLYVYFIPIFMLDSPASEFKSGDGLIYGNGRIRPMKQYPLSITDDYSIREKGMVLFGEDIKDRFPEPPDDCFFKMLIHSIPYIEEAVKKHPFQYSEEHDDHTTVNWLLYFPRLLYSLVRGDMIGKSNAAYWFQEKYDSLLGEFIHEIGTSRQENASIRNDKDLVLKSRELVIFTIDSVLEFKGVEVSLRDLACFDSITMDFNPIMAKFRELLE